MPIMDKLLGLATVGSTITNVTLFHRFLSNIASVIVLAVVSALFGCMLLIGGFCAVYFGLVHYGLEPFAAAITVAALVILLLGGAIGLTSVHIRRLRELPYHALQRDLPGLSRAGHILDAFLEGLAGSSASSKH